jgi:hypothetical protein
VVVSAGGWVEKEEEVTLDRFVAVDGRRGAGGRPADGAQAAWPRSASVRGAPAWERGGVVHWTRPIALEEGSARERACAWAGRRRTGRPPACSGLQDRRCAGRLVHCLYRRARQRDGEGQRGQARGRPGRSVRRRAGEDVRRRGVRRPRHARDVGKGQVALGRHEGTSEGARTARMRRWAALGRGRRAAAGARWSALSAEIYSEYPYLTTIFSRNLNRSAQCDE